MKKEAPTNLTRKGIKIMDSDHQPKVGKTTSKKKKAH